MAGAAPQYLSDAEAGFEPAAPTDAAPIPSPVSGPGTPYQNTPGSIGNVLPAPRPADPVTVTPLAPAAPGAYLSDAEAGFADAPAPPAAPTQPETPQIPDYLGGAGVQPISDYLYRSFAPPMLGAWANMKKHAEEQGQAQDAVMAGDPTLHDRWTSMSSIPQFGADAFALAASPIAGLTTAAVSKPIGSAMNATGLPIYRPPQLNDLGAPRAQITDPEERQQAFEGIVNTGLSAVAPARGGTAALARPPPLLGGLEATIPPEALNPALRYVAPRVANPDPVVGASSTPLPLFLQGGDPAISAVRTLARRPGSTAGALQEVVGDPLNPDPALQGLRGGSADRLQASVQEATGVSPAAARGDMEALTEELRAGQVRPAYTAALSGPVNRTEQLAAVLEEPEVQKALAYAERKIGKAARDPATGEPTAEALDLTKKYLGKMVARDQLTGQAIKTGEVGIGNDFVEGHLRTLTDALAGSEKNAVPAAIPGYRAALNEAGDVLEMERAHAMGRDHIFNTKTPAADFAAQVSGMSAADLAAARGGAANQIFNLAQRGGLSPKTLATPIVRGKLEALFGKDATARMLKAAGQEKAIVDGLRAASPKGQTTTATDTAEMAAMDTHPIAAHAGEWALNSLLAGPHVATTKLALNVGAPMVRGLFSRLGAPSQAVRDAAGQILLSPDITPAEVLAYLKHVRQLPGPVPQGVLRFAPPAAGVLAGTDAQGTR